MKLVYGILLGVLVALGLTAFGQLAPEEEGGPAPEPTREDPRATSSKGTIFENADAKGDANRSDEIQPKTDRPDTNWKNIWIKASVPDVHYNINQPAKKEDANATSWSHVFHLDAPFRGLDVLYFCAPVDSFTVWAADDSDWTLVYEGVLEKVQPC